MRRRRGRGDCFGSTVDRIWDAASDLISASRYHASASSLQPLENPKGSKRPMGMVMPSMSWTAASCVLGAAALGATKAEAVAAVRAMMSFCIF